MTETIFDQANLSLDETFAERVRRLGDSSCKAGIETTIRYLSEKTQLSDKEIEMLSAGNIPEHIRQRDFEAYIKKLNKTNGFKMNEKDKSKGMCEDAFASGLSTVIY